MKRGADTVLGAVTKIESPRLKRVATLYEDDFRSLGSEINRAKNRLDIEAQHGRQVHILMENGVPCDKWVDLPEPENVLIRRP